MNLGTCLEYTATGIIHANWLAATARKELLRFREFMKWIRYGASTPASRLRFAFSYRNTETGRANTTGDHNAPRAQHDLLEVSEYLTGSLIASPIDKWFVGAGPRVSRASLGVPDEEADLDAALTKARAALALWDQTVQEVRGCTRRRGETGGPGTPLAARAQARSLARSLLLHGTIFN